MPPGRGRGLPWPHLGPSSFLISSRLWLIHFWVLGCLPIRGPQLRVHPQSLHLLSCLGPDSPCIPAFFVPPTSETHGAGQIAVFNSDSSTSWLRGRGQLASPLCALVFPLCRMGAVTVGDICENSNSFMNIGCKDGKKPRSHLRAGVGSKQGGEKKKGVCSRKTRDECWQN